MTTKPGTLGRGAARALHANGWLLAAAAGLATAADGLGPAPDRAAWTLAGAATLAGCIAVGVAAVTARRVVRRWTTWHVAHGRVSSTIHRGTLGDEQARSTVWIAFDNDELAEITVRGARPIVGSPVVALIGPNDAVVIAQPGATVRIDGDVLRPRPVVAAVCAAAFALAAGWWVLALVRALG